ncbi:probable malonyl-CoA-acyl carrier protein transacylase, mitochondrial isoform X1 [Varroa jacobsoni]|uniref:probable malonyl-CoA-acyl carrier protein transacylase, mitochondrial isoform X1 n=1 Tax=Varroa jacobsoni TaxID=62625 RepID=UPI000BF93629|nr:probable malonyl-CoA-acyl carrier protein transacylase, mitochondrial isoform X1 [Varroa jacobsoni]
MNFYRLFRGVLTCSSVRLYNKSTKRPEVSELLRDASTFELNSIGDQWNSDTYPIERSLKNKLRAEAVLTKPMKDPRSTTVVLFPGQGAQYTGMAKNLLTVPGVKDMFNFASSVMKIDLLKLCLDGPQEVLNMTINCQAAMLLTSLAALEKLKLSSPELIERCTTTAGFSVGEYSALVFGGAISFEDTVHLVKLRGEAMQICSEERPSGLMTVFLRADSKLNLGTKLAREWCQEREKIKDPVCEIASHLFPHCKVIGGDEKALEFLQRNAREFNLKKCKRLTVSGAFHTKLMKPAKDVLANALNKVVINPPAIQVMSNFSAKPYKTPEMIRKHLVQQIYSPVKWEQVMQKIYMRNDDVPFPNTYEVGPGDTLRPILKMVNARAYEQSYKHEI